MAMTVIERVLMIRIQAGGQIFSSASSFPGKSDEGTVTVQDI